MPNITYGRRVRGLLEYLWGRGKSDEHRDPRIVAGYDDPDVLAPPRHPLDGDRWDLSGLAGRLDAPQVAAGARGVRRYVWQCSLSLPPEERDGEPLDDATWARIAHRFIEEMGFAGSADQAGCRWVAVRHGPSAGGNDHIHLVVTLATEDGAPVWLRGDKRRSQQVCDRIEDEHGLGKWGVRRDRATVRRPVSRAEVERARRDGQDAPQRAVVRRAVRAALAGARDEGDFVRRLHAGGLAVAAYPRAGADTARAGGYSVSLPARVGGQREWFAGRTLDGDLSLPRIRQRWVGEALTVAEWRAIPAESRALAENARMEVWRRAAAALMDVGDRVAAEGVDSPQWPAIVRATGDLLARVAVSVEPEAIGPVSRAADILLRAAAPRRADPPAARSALAEDLGRVADALLITGAARGGEATLATAVVVAVSRLVVVLGELRAAQRQVYAAGAAQAAAARLMPLLRQLEPAAAPVADRGHVPTRDTVPTTPHVDRRGGDRGERDAGR